MSLHRNRLLNAHSGALCANEKETRTRVGVCRLQEAIPVGIIMATILRIGVPQSKPKRRTNIRPSSVHRDHWSGRRTASGCGFNDRRLRVLSGAESVIEQRSDGPQGRACVSLRDQIGGAPEIGRGLIPKSKHQGRERGAVHTPRIAGGFDSGNSGSASSCAFSVERIGGRR
jgi:hypothetical protein